MGMTMLSFDSSSLDFTNRFLVAELVKMTSFMLTTTQTLTQPAERLF